MNLKNTYFGFTNGKKPMQAAKIEKSLDMLIKFDEDNKIKSNKEFVYMKLEEGCKPEFEENYTYYSTRKDDWTKPRTLYKLVYPNGTTFHEINKTLYNYALHLIDNNFLNEEVARQYIVNKIKEKEEKGKLEQERIKKEREEKQRQQEKEEKERKERFEEKQKEWKENALELIKQFDKNPIIEVLNYHWNEVKERFPDTSEEDYFNNMSEKFTIMLGNKNQCIHLLQYYVENETDEFDPYKREFDIKNNPIQKLEKDILMKVFNITKEDKNITITAKVKAVFEGREYKGSNQNRETA